MKTLSVLATVALTVSMTACVTAPRRDFNALTLSVSQVDDIAKMNAAGKVRAVVGVEPTEARAFPEPSGPGYRIVELDTMQVGQKATYVVICRISDLITACSSPALKSR